ncbi:MAG: fatty acid desaturase [Deltaproteobacteria bacterium]
MSCVTLWGVVFWAGGTRALPASVCVACASVLSYVSYIAAHDAAHGGMSRHRWLNGCVGRCCLLLLSPLFSFSAFRYLHLQHHAATNDPSRDPDMWASSSRPWSLPLRFASLDLAYYVFYFRRLRQRPTREVVETLATAALAVLGLGIALRGGWGWNVLLFWILPGRVAMFVLAWLLDYLPHQPHRIRQRDDAFRATRIRVGMEAWLSPIMLWQNYHLVHHLYPRAPFWLMVRLWRAHERWHLQQGPVMVSVSGKPLNEAEYRRRRGLAE